MELKIKFKVLHYIQHDFFRQRLGLSKDQASYNLGQNILELYNVLVQIRISISKIKRDISVTNLLYELPNDLRLRILGKRETVGNSQIWVETQPSAQFSFQKLNFGNSSQKARKSRY